MSEVKKEDCTCSCSCESDMKWLHRRIDSVNEDYQRLRKMLRIVVAILVDKKLIGENIAKSFMESKERGDADKLIEWLVENL